MAIYLKNCLRELIPTITKSKIKTGKTLKFYSNRFLYLVGVVPKTFFTYRVKNDRLENIILSAISAKFRFLFCKKSMIRSLVYRWIHSDAVTPEFCLQTKFKYLGVTLSALA